MGQLSVHIKMSSCTDPENFVRGGFTLTFFVVVFVVCFILVNQGREGPSTTISGPSLA